MNNSSGLFQVDELLATKLRGSGLEKHVEVIAQIESDHENGFCRSFGSDDEVDGPSAGWR